MEMLPVYGNALWTQECTCYYFRIVVSSFKYFIHKFLEVYFDDWTVFGLVRDHIEIPCMMLGHYHQYQIMLNSKKCIFCAPFGVLLGHVICHDGILVKTTKIVIILDLPPPTSATQLRSVLGHIGYYRKFIRGYAEIIAPIEKLLKKYVKFQWMEPCQECLYKLKNKIAILPILVFIN